jgi:hypothetical protein
MKHTITIIIVLSIINYILFNLMDKYIWKEKTKHNLRSSIICVIYSIVLVELFKYIFK